jgi:hypothetical protein
MVIGGFSSSHRTGFCVPDLAGVFGGELSGPSDMQNRLSRDPSPLRVQFTEPLIRREIRFEIRQVHVVVSIDQQAIRYD